jgi:5-oxoprolinase (ATP-hydrolysing)
LRQALPPHKKIKGPAFIVDSNSTVVIDPDFEVGTDETGIITVKRLAAERDSAVPSTGKPDPVLLEVFNNFFMGAATEMGITLRNTAHSVNIKERLDFSCAVFDAEGDLVANAPHIPVHLGSMADTVKALIDFTGTGPQHTADNLNAPFSVTRSAVMYVLRTLIDEDIPLNGGCLKPVTIIISEARNNFDTF